MDLAAIRKKANSVKERDHQAGSPPGTQEEIVPPIAGKGKHAEGGIFEGREAIPPLIDVSEGDPLAALFDAPHDLELATEETYLQALSDQGEKDESESRKFLTFTLDNEEYALDIASIREIIRTREITDIPRVPNFILGIISLRGIIIPVYDLKQRLRLGTVKVSEGSRIIISQVENRIVGLLVDQISQVVQLSKQTIEPPPSVLTGIDRDLVEGVGRHQNRMMILLNLPCVIDAELF